MRRRLSIENHFVKISTMMKDYGLPEEIDEEDGLEEQECSWIDVLGSETTTELGLKQMY